MALTRLQRRVCRLLAENRIASGESYVAGGAALNEILGAPRLSRNVDLFHDTDEALDSSWRADRGLLEREGLGVRQLRERAGLIEAEVDDGSDRARLEWSRDSAFRFFPLREHDELGLTLHPFDLATNKVLALVGRLEVRDWVDVIATDERIQPLGYLAWAAAGKDPGFGPAAIIEAAARSGRYSVEEVGELTYEGDPPDAADLGRRWHRMLDDARATITVLPPDEAGTCVLDAEGDLLRIVPGELRATLASGHVHFHRGTIRSAMPRLT
ncbi:MAG: hypothetical protein PVG27_05740 [Chloroflexota bacterium]|jgi:hypothetical protein